jgi:hypothetical protein
VLSTPSICLFLTPAGRPSNVSSIHQNLWFGIVVTIAEDVDVRAIRIVKGFIALRLLTTRLMGIDTGVPEMAGH